MCNGAQNVLFFLMKSNLGRFQYLAKEWHGRVYYFPMADLSVLNYLRATVPCAALCV